MIKVTMYTKSNTLKLEYATVISYIMFDSIKFITNTNTNTNTYTNTSTSIIHELVDSTTLSSGYTTKDYIFSLSKIQTAPYKYSNRQVTRIHQDAVLEVSSSGTYNHLGELKRILYVDTYKE